MKVTLLSHTPNPTRTVAASARLCYSDSRPDELYDNITDEYITKLIANLKASGHLSAFEHASFTFGISDISRTCTHQLVRHRMASYNQQSQRYVKYEGSVPCVVPNTVVENIEALSIYLSAIEKCSRVYSKLLELGVNAEDARYVLPNATCSNIVVTMNARELLHFFSLRCCNRAQWEIRDLAWEMLKICKDISPEIFSDAGPGCVRGCCPEGKMTCGEPYAQIK